MEKYLLTLELRYNDVINNECGHLDKKITIGVYDTFEESCEAGNRLMELMESKFPLHKFPQGYYASKERFSKYDGGFRSKKTLISDLAYLKTPFTFYANIETLRYLNVEDCLSDATEAQKRYKANRENKYE